MLSREFLKDRGYCCGHGCLMCPYEPKHTKENKVLADDVCLYSGLPSPNSYRKKGNTNMREIKQIYVTGVNRSGHSTLWEKIKVDPDIPSAMMGDEQFMLPWDIENHNHTDMLRKRFVDRVKQLVECSPDCNTHLDMGHYWLPHIPWLVENFDVQIHIIKRNKDDDIDAFMQKFEDHVENDVVQKFRTTDMSATNWEIAYPTYEVIKGLGLQANYKIHASMFYDDYYTMAEKFLNAYPDKVHMHASEHLIEGDNYKKLF